MGAIRVKVRLTNATDEALARRGQLPESAIKSIEADALVDTGAASSVIPAHIMQQLGIAPRGRRVTEYADGRKDEVDITESLVFEIQGRDTLDEALILGNEVLVGQTILEKLDYLADCRNGRLIPNPAHPDGPVSVVKYVRLAK